MDMELTYDNTSPTRTVVFLDNNGLSPFMSTFVNIVCTFAYTPEGERVRAKEPLSWWSVHIPYLFVYLDVSVCVTYLQMYAPYRHMDLLLYAWIGPT